jgi:hypothetical protein
VLWISVGTPAVLAEEFREFPQSLRRKLQDPEPFSSIYFVIHHLSVILSHGVRFVTIKAPLNNRQEESSSAVF